MTKPLTLSLSLAVAFGLCNVSLAGGHGKIMPSGQGPSPQVVPSAQEIGCGGDICGPVKKCHLFSGFKMPHFSLPKLHHTTSYEWVLRKKHHFSFGHGGCAEPVCETCGVWPSGQGPSPQGAYAAPQAGYAAPQAAGQAMVGSGQAAALTPVVTDPAAEPPTLPRDAAETADKPAEAPKQADAGGLLLLSPSGY